MKPFDPRLPRYAAAAGAGIAAAIGLGLVTTGLVVAQAVLLARAIAAVSFDGASLGSLRGTMLALGAVLLGRVVVAYAGEAVAATVAVATKRQLRSRLVRRVLDLGPSWLVRHGTGELTTLASRGLDALDAYFARFVPQLVLAATVPAVVVGLLAGVDWPSALTITVTLPLIPVFMVLIGLHTQARTERQWDLLQRLGGHFLDVVEGLPTLLVFRRAKAQVETIRTVTDDHRRRTMATLRVAFLSALVLELLATLSTAVVAVEVGFRLLDGGLPYHTALLVLLLTPEAYLPLRSVGTQYHASREGAVAAARALDVLAEPGPAGIPPPRSGAGSAVAGPAGAPVLAGPVLAGPVLAGSAVAGSAVAGLPRLPAVEFAAVTLRYPDRSTPALTGVSLTIEPADRLVVLGPSGGGKSSLLALLLRFVEPTDGELRCGGTALADLPVDGWRRQIAWVPQSPHLFSGTVADNVALGCPTADRAGLDRAARLAGLDEVLAGLPDGWDTELGEQALRLSAGQRQRVALARAFLRDAPLLLLDEPTAHLDPAGAAAVRDGVREHLGSDRTLVVVAHDAGWADLADRVVHVDGGQLGAAFLVSR